MAIAVALAQETATQSWNLWCVSVFCQQYDQNEEFQKKKPSEFWLIKHFACAPEVISIICILGSKAQEG